MGINVLRTMNVLYQSILWIFIAYGKWQLAIFQTKTKLYDSCLSRTQVSK